jgi:integrase
MAVAPHGMTQRHRKARGSIEQRAGRVSLRIPVQQVDASTGEIQSKRARIDLGSVSDIRSETAARRLADGWIGRNMPGHLQQGESIGFAAYAEQFLAQHAALFRRSSRRNYTTRLRNHLVPELGGQTLWTISPAVIRDVLAHRRAAGLRRSTLQGVRATLLQVLKQARIDGYDAQTIEPWLVRLPAEDIAEREQRFISEPELEQILASSEYPWRALWAVMGLAGLRISEALGLAWQHLELEASPVMHVRQGASDGELLPLKTRTSRADLPMDPRLTELLREYRGAWQPNDAGLLFATKTGRPKAYRDVRAYQWLPLLKRLGLPHAGFHALRHGLPRRLFAAGCSAQVVKALMRHSNLQTTERYSHHTADDLRAAINAATQIKPAHPRPALPQSAHAMQENKP